MNPSDGPRNSSNRAKAVDHALAQLYMMASQCYATGRVDDAIGYGDGGRLAIESGRYDEVPFELEAFAQAAVYVRQGIPSDGSSCAATSSRDGRAPTSCPGVPGAGT